MFFETPGERGANKDRHITIRWHNDFEPSSRFIYYGTGTRDEYRLTKFGKRFLFLTDDNVGDLLVLVKKSNDFFEGYVLSSDEGIENFFSALNISSIKTNGIISRQFHQTDEYRLLQCFKAYIKTLDVDFPTTIDMATKVRHCYISSYNVTETQIKSNPDEEILNWIEAKYELFKMIENDRYSEKIRVPFQTVEDLVKSANTILNRRKSRAGKSLEHHLGEVFRIFELSFQIQVRTENNKNPDFIFPNIKAYNNPNFDNNKLILLAAKTTCKYR